MSPSPTLRTMLRSSAHSVTRKGAYVLLPPNFSSTHVRADNNRRTGTIAAAIEAAGVPHVVLLSSIGAQQAEGTGPVLGLHDAEAVFTRGRAAATFVRAAYFMENWVANSIRSPDRPSRTISATNRG